MQLLGSLWSTVYSGWRLLETRARGVGELFQDAQRILNEAQDCLSVHDIPVWHTREWWPLTIRKSDVLTGDSNLARYDEDGLYYDASGLAYDVVLKTHYAVPLPDGLAEVDIICNRITDPSLVLVNGVDFSISDGRLLFVQNPFDNAELVTQPVFTAGTLSDEEMVLWAHRARFDRKLIRNHFGYVLGLDLPSGQEYKDVVRQAFSAISGGTSLLAVLQLLASAVGLPLAQQLETVEDIYSDTRYRYVVTDARVYRFPAEYSTVLSVGDSLGKGGSPATAFEYDDWATGQLSNNFPALVLEPGLLDPRISEPLSFANADLPLSSAGGAVTFPLGGRQQDIDQFWSLVRTREADSGTTLESAIKAGNNGTLPATINPAKFLVSNILRNNARGVRIQVATTTVNTVDLVLAAVMRKLLPPHVWLFILLELPTLQDSDTITDATGITQDEMDTMTDTLGSSFTAANPESSYESIVCA